MSQMGIAPERVTIEDKSRNTDENARFTAAIDAGVPLVNGEPSSVMVERARGVQRAQVVSAVPLEAGEIERLHRELERTTGKKIRLTTLVDPAIIGGAYVRIGDRIVDRSVKTLLESISNQLYEVSL